jgi:PAS domain S-box-containing protein
MLKPIRFQFFHSKTTTRNGWRALSILILGLLLTGMATYYTYTEVKNRVNQDFTSVCNELKIKIISRLHAHAQLLRTASALFAASDSVTREAWKAFIDRSAIEKNLPGIQGVGYSIFIRQNQLQQHIENIRKEGFTGYSVNPTGERDWYAPVIYLEPFSGSNLRAFGFDAFSEPIRRKAMELSRDSDIAMLSGPVVLVQESQLDQQTGLVLYVPVYRKDMDINSVEQRRSAIQGWVYCPYRMNNLMSGILDQWDSKQLANIRLQIYNDSFPEKSLLFDNHNNENFELKKSGLNNQIIAVRLNGTKWLLQFTQSSQKYADHQSKVFLVFFSGLFISVLLCLLSMSLFNTSKRANQIANQLTLELKKSEEHLREVLENSLDASYKRNLQTGKYDYLSPVFVRISGFTPEEVQTLPIESVLDLMHPDDVTVIDRELASILSDNTCITDQLEYRFRHKDGQYRWFQDRFTVVRDAKNKPVSLIGSVSDITPRKLIEEALQNEKLLLRTVIDNIPDSIYCLDSDCRKTLANLTDIRYMGAKSESEVIGKNDFDFYPLDIAKSFFRIDNEVIKTGKPLLNCEEFLMDENGEKRWLLSSKLPMRNKNGEITGLLGIGRDITDRKMAEEEIKHKNEELQRVNAEKDKFFSIIAHDLRSPFNGFLGLTQIMAEDLQTLTMDEIQSISEILKDSAMNLFRLLENLLEWARIHQGLIPFEPKLTELKLINNEVMGMLSDWVKNKEIEIVCNIADGLMVYADSNMLQAIIRNLVSNATKFTHKGGQITISARINQDHLVEISIKDNGIGMSNKIVDGLFRLDINTSRKGTDGEASTGLGLIICKEFVEKNGGNLWVESQEGKGSTFYITIRGNNS